MARYQFTTQDRSKGGKRTAEVHDMAERGRIGFQSFADRYFGGDLTLAGKALSKMGNFATDPARWNTAWSLPAYFPDTLKQSLIAKILTGDNDVPF